MLMKSPMMTTVDEDAYLKVRIEGSASVQQKLKDLCREYKIYSLLRYNENQPMFHLCVMTITKSYGELITFEPIYLRDLSRRRNRKR